MWRALPATGRNVTSNSFTPKCRTQEAIPETASTASTNVPRSAVRRHEQVDRRDERGRGADEVEDEGVRQPDGGRERRDRHDRAPRRV